MPSIVAKTDGPELVGKANAVAAVVGVPEIVPRNCHLDGYDPVNVPPFKANGQIIAYASPDSTFAVTKRLIDGAKKSILIGIYDFTADHVKQLVLKAMQRGVKVELMLDIDGKAEVDLFNDLEQFGADCTPAPSCSSKRTQVFRSSHEKVIVIDNRWSLVQSGNYSDNSIPLNVTDGGDPDDFTTGNRDMGLAVESPAMAKFFRKILEADIALELAGAQGAAVLARVVDTFLVEKAPTKLPKKLFPSKTFNLQKELSIQPVLSPDNYMSTIPDYLANAKKSIYIEQQYIRAAQPHIQTLLESIKTARESNPTLDVRIVLGKVFSKKDLDKERKNLATIKANYGLVLGKNIRYVDTARLVHCHNKMVLVDGTGVLVSSQNWSDAAVSENREAGLLFNHKGIRDYFAAIFESDWATALKDPSGVQPEVLAPETVRAGGFIRVMAGDYAEV